MDTLDCMRVFAAVAAERSFTAGARRLDLSTRVASAAIRQLEQRLNTRLLNRTTRVVRLTEAGEAYLSRCSQLLRDFDELESVVQERQGRLAGSIRVTAPTGFGSSRLAPELPGFLQRHPDISVDLDLTDRRVSLIDEGFDLAIRLGTLRDSSLMYRRLARMRIVVCAAPGYLRKHGRPQHPQDVAGHECLLNAGLPDPHRWRFVDQGQTVEVRVTGRVQANAPLALAHLARRGLGLARCPYYSIEPFLRSGELVSLLEAYERDDGGVFAVYPPNRHLAARVRGLISYLQERWDGAWG
ncbi:MAG: LysR substrate-binding domain-containing protein [Nevskiales bacterium]|nr:LysR substrate-binding domain-containing protein [Nevskiales bacterium]